VCGAAELAEAMECVGSGAFMVFRWRKYLVLHVDLNGTLALGFAPSSQGLFCAN
jgi:hypothetical protein